MRRHLFDPELERLAALAAGVGAMMSGFPRPVSSIPGAVTIGGVATLNGGTNTAGLANTYPTSNPTNGTAVQNTAPTDLFAYLVFSAVTVAGLASVLTGPTSGTANIVWPAFLTGVGSVYLAPFVCPAGFWYKVSWVGTLTATLITQNI